MDLINLLDGYNIVVCDDSITVLRILSSYLEKAGGKVFAALNGQEGYEFCRKHKIHLIISDINMPEMNGFELIKKLDSENYNIPKIIITDAEIDEYLSLAKDHNIGNILSKPIEMKELITTCYKLITGERVFGLINYMITRKLYKADISHSREIQKVIDSILKFGLKHGLSASKSDFLSIILDEVLSNAVYHAHGFTKEKEKRQEISLRNDDKVEVCFCANSKQLGISVTDFKGVLTKQIILKSFQGVVEEKKLIQQASHSGEDVYAAIGDTGRGLQMIRLMANEYYFNIKVNRMTQVIIIVDLEDSKKQKTNSSIKIHEIY